MTVGWASYALAKSPLNVMLLDKLYSRITADDRTMIILISSYYGWEQLQAQEQGLVRQGEAKENHAAQELGARTCMEIMQAPDLAKGKKSARQMRGQESL